MKVPNHIHSCLKVFYGSTYLSIRGTKKNLMYTLYLHSLVMQNLKYIPCSIFITLEFCPFCGKKLKR